MNRANLYTGNPDRSGSSTRFPAEANKRSTMNDVFGWFNGSKHMPYIIDGEDSGSYHFDLSLAPGHLVSADNSASTVELGVLQQGGNSGFNVYGINAEGSLTGVKFVGRSNGARVRRTLDTLEIDGAQTVGGVGIALDATWKKLRGFRIETLSGFDGPDIVAVGTRLVSLPPLIPGPASLGLLALAAPDAPSAVAISGIVSSPTAWA
ncbi:MAG: exosortase-dependent surface protein XDP2 [Phycisphaerales bacterium]